MLRNYVKFFNYANTGRKVIKKSSKSFYSKKNESLQIISTKKLVMKIGILSDTHGFIHPKIFDFFAQCDEVWHAGDMVSTDILEQLSTITKVRGVYGNCDDWDVRKKYKEVEVFKCEKHTVFLKHIIGNPRYYDPVVLSLIKKAKATIVVAGHSHILQIINDAKNGWLFINPGGGGKFGQHTHITFIRFDIKGTDITNMEVYDEVKS